mgnify:CR=1 FL=1
MLQFNPKFNQDVYKPEKLKYSQNECSVLKYNTKSLTAKGPIDKINIVSGGYGYRKIPIFVGSNSINGKDAFIVAISTSIGNAREVRILDEGFEYSSDKTLQPISYISSVISIKNSNTIGVVTVTSGGNQYINSPSIISITELSCTSSAIANSLDAPPSVRVTFII